MLHDRLL